MHYRSTRPVIVSLKGGAEDMETPLNPENSGPHIS
jgi:hypothetical protein